MITSADKIDQIFWTALQLTSEDERRAYLDRACSDDAELRRLVEKLLRAEPKAAAFLEQPLPGSLATADEPIREGPGAIIGPYRLLEPIGEGGFGVVFLAEQTQPVRRRVALKVLKPGMDTRQVVARFEAERQALAILDHPNIAKVFDGGATPSGRPYFVMELVKGVPITAFCDQNQLTPRQRLELFVPVCQAVQHAHQKGIIHRDLKPANVLVSRHDTTPVVKVIDFGIAKALGQQLTDKTLFTGLAQMLGTPLYMSPEQAGMSDLDVDTRSDVYSLGVLLYELLTGSTPFTRERFKQAGYDEIRRIIREEDPPRPSTRLSESKETLPSISAQRQTERAHLTRLVRGELDWIVMKSLEKDRNRRYESASAFAADVRRYLNDEPVEAGPPTAGYKLRKFARKHRRPLATAAAFLTLLLLSVVVSAWQAVRATAATEAERQAKEHEAEERHKAEAAEKEARESEADTEAFSKFLVQDVLSVARPEGEQGGLGIEVTVKRALVEAARKISERFRGRPRAEAVARHDLGETFSLIGDPDRAVEQYLQALALRRQALGPEHRDTLTSMNNLAVAYEKAGKLDLALPLQEEAFRLQKARLGPEDPDMLTCMNNLAVAYYKAGKLDLALPLYEETFRLQKAKLGPEHRETLISTNNLAAAYEAAGRLELALPLYEETLKLRKAKLGPEHPDTLLSTNNLALAYKNAGKLDLALPLLEQTLKLRKAKLGPEHPNTLTSMNNLAAAYQDAG
jgi:serine/threonine protein kinase